jgi:hypothetical protein
MYLFVRTNRRAICTASLSGAEGRPKAMGLALVEHSSADYHDVRRGVLPKLRRLRSHPSNLNLDNASAGTGSTTGRDVPVFAFVPAPLPDIQ